MKTLETQNQTIETKTDDLEARSIRENLLFMAYQKQTMKTEVLVKQFLAEKLNIVQDIILDRTHRLGKPRGNNRSVVVTFHSYKDRELVRTTPQTKSAELQNINQGVGIQ